MESSKIKIYAYLILSLIIILLIFYNLFWLSLIIIFSIALFTIGSFAIEKIRNGRLKDMMKILGLFSFIFLNTILIRVLLFDLYAIPSESMKDTLKVGDVILVNKLAYGPQVPKSINEIPWLNLLTFLDDTISKNRFGESELRLQGVSNIKRGDIFVFERDKWKNNKILKETLVKRCMGLPGDTITIENSEVLINSEIFAPNDNIRHRFNAWAKNKQELLETFEKLELDTKDIIYHDNTSITIFASMNTILKLKDFKVVDSIKISIDKPRKRQYLLGKSINEDWTLDNMGPILIPKKGMKINLTLKLFSLYRKILKINEGLDINSLREDLTSNQNKTIEYTFKNDYFFMMGDNRKNSMDSRMFGFISRSNIIGKVYIVVSSKKI